MVLSIIFWALKSIPVLLILMGIYLHVTYNYTVSPNTRMGYYSKIFFHSGIIVILTTIYLSITNGIEFYLEHPDIESVLEFFMYDLEEYFFVLLSCYFFIFIYAVLFLWVYTVNKNKKHKNSQMIE